MSNNDKLTLSQDEIANRERVWSGEELFRVTNEQLRAVCVARGLVYESDANKRALVKTIMDDQVAREGGEDENSGAALEEEIAQENARAAESFLEDEAEAFTKELAGAEVDGVLALDARGVHAEAEVAAAEDMVSEGAPDFAGIYQEEAARFAEESFGLKKEKQRDTLHGSIDDIVAPY